MSRVLVVDDEPHVRRVMQMTLERSGFDVVTAADGQAGLEMVRVEMPDYIVLDIEMPRMNGIEMCRKLCEEFPERQCKIFVASSRPEPEFRDWINGYDNIEFIEKPVSLKSLTRALSI